MGKGRKTAGRALAATAVVLGVLAVSQNAWADEPCTSRTTSKAFSAWGDNNFYFQVPNAGFESGSGRWTLTGGASVVTGNETWKINGSTHSKSLRIPAGATAATEKICVNSDEDSLRFFYKKPGVAGSALHIGVRVTSGVNVATNDLDVDGSTAGWAVSDRMMLPDIRDASGQQWVQITYSTRNAAATWQVDDTMIDPWKTK